MFTPLQRYYLNALGIQPQVSKPLPSISSQPSLLQLSQEVSACQRCALATTRCKTVFSRGSAKAALMVIGEAPGFYEDQQGLPFVGKAGELLDKMLKSIALAPEEVYIANVLKCRPPNNRDPRPEEIDCCSPYLLQQIQMIRPRLILALGRFSGQFLIKKPLSVGQLREKVHYFQEIPFIVSYHPAYLLRNPLDKKKAYQDLLKVKQILDGNDKK